MWTDGVDWSLGCAVSAVRPLATKSNSSLSLSVFFFYLKKYSSRWIALQLFLCWTIYPMCDFTKRIPFSIRWKNVEDRSTVLCHSSGIELVVFVQVIRVGFFPPFWTCAFRKLWVSSISASRAQLPGCWDAGSLGCSFQFLFFLDFLTDNCIVLCENSWQSTKYNAENKKLWN